MAIWAVSTFIWSVLLNTAILGNLQGGAPFFRGSDPHLVDTGGLLGNFTIDHAVSPPVVVWYSTTGSMVWELRLVFEHAIGNVSYAWPWPFKEKEEDRSTSYVNHGLSLPWAGAYSARLNSSRPANVGDSLLLLNWPTEMSKLHVAPHTLLLVAGTAQWILITGVFRIPRKERPYEHHQGQERMIVLAEGMGHMMLSMGLAWTIFDVTEGLPVNPVFAYLAPGMGIFFLGYRLIPWLERRAKEREARRRVSRRRRKTQDQSEADQVD